MSLFVVCDNRNEEEEKRRRGIGKEGEDEKQVLKNGNQMEWGMEREMSREMWRMEKGKEEEMRFW